MNLIALQVKLSQCLPTATVLVEGKKYIIKKEFGIAAESSSGIKLSSRNGKKITPYTLEQAKQIDCLLVSGPFTYKGSQQSKRKIGDLWFVYGNRGQYSSNMGHYFYQGFLEHGEWSPYFGRWGNLKPDMPMFKDFIKAAGMQWELVDIKYP